jgi:glycosyltransferase involved in cell wall biosynthesis
MVAEDYYGPNYLFDMALASTYSRAAVVGKSSYFRLRNGEPERMDHGEPYTPVAQLLARQSLIATDRIGQEIVRSWLQSLPKRRYRGAGDFLATDVYNYCRKAGTAADQVTERVDDLTDLDTGIPLAELQSTAETAPPAESAGDEPKLGPAELKDLFGERGSRHVKVMADAGSLRIRSTLADGKHEYVYAARDLERDELVSGEELRGFLDTSPGLNVSLVILFLDAQGQRINHVIHQANRNFTTETPPETARLRLGLRVYQGGEADVNAIALAHRNLEPPFVLGRGRVLVLTNHYPSYDDLYRNGFVHTRVRAYREHGLDVDVFRLRPDQPISWHEFEGFDVTTGSAGALRRMLKSAQYKSVAVHFLNSRMWSILQEFLDSLSIAVWVHGAEIHPWWRRKFNYENEADLENAKIRSDERMQFWQPIFRSTHENLHFVFVSNTFAREVMEDYGVRIPPQRYSVIHNPIDTDNFRFNKKSPEQRKKILSVRPYASHQYANDIVVRAILQLSRTTVFHEFEFRLIGDGRLFEETVAPLRHFHNVTIERRFITHSELAFIHKEYGVFLCPSRWDSQGVSRDEAMASGLVPVTTKIAAIPEFVDETCGLLVEPESVSGIVEALCWLIDNPQSFSSLSESAANRVRQQSHASTVAKREIGLLAHDC